MLLFEEFLELLLKLVEKNKRRYFTMNEIVKFILRRCDDVSVTTIIYKVYMAKRKGFIRVEYKLDNTFGFKVKKAIYHIQVKMIEYYLKRVGFKGNRGVLNEKGLLGYASKIS